MKKCALLGFLVLFAGSLIAAESKPAAGADSKQVIVADSKANDEVVAAAKKLADKANYSWRSTVVVPEDSPFHPGPTDGKTEKDGMTSVKLSFGDNTTEFVLKGDKAAVNSQGEGWKSLSEIDSSDFPGRFLTGMIKNFKAPAGQAAEIAGYVKELKKEGDVYSGPLTEEGAKNLLRFRRGSDATVSNAKGSAKFWVKDGVLTKFEFKVTGAVSFNGNDMDVDRTTTVEIKDVGTTKIDVPEDAKKKLS